MSERESLCASCGLRAEDHDRGDAIGRAALAERLHGCATFVSPALPGPTLYAKLMDRATRKPIEELRTRIVARIEVPAMHLADEFAEMLRHAYAEGVRDGYAEAVREFDGDES